MIISHSQYEYRCLLDLLMTGHPNGAKKVGKGIQGIQVRTYFGKKTTSRSRACCFHVIRKDGTIEDFSYIKSLDNLFRKV